MKSNIYLSIAIPLYNEEKNVEELYRQMSQFTKKLGKSHEVVAVDDGSVDSTLDKLVAISKKDINWKIVSLSRNFGHEEAVTAALDHTSGEVVALMDGDLQDDPEFIGVMLEKLNQDFDVVYARHSKRQDGPIRDRLFAFFYWLLDHFVDFEIPLYAGAFSVMRRKVVGTLCSLTERNRYVSGLRAWIGFKQTGVDYEKRSRFAGTPPQTFRKLLRMGLDAGFSFSYIPLRLSAYLGLVVTFGAVLGIVDVLLQKFVFGTAILGWAGPTISILVIGGTQLIILGIIGEYLGRIYDEVKRRPNYIVSEKIGF